MNNILDDLKYRNLIKDFSNEEEVRELLSTPQTIYCGFDPSASSMHVGNYVMISILMRLQRAGHKIIALVGGATGMIGDPSGKSSERNLQGKEAVAENTRCIKEQLEKFLDFSDPNKGIIVNNYDWIAPMSTIDFLRDYGKHFSVNYMLSKDIVSSRLEKGVSFTEFSYMILQSLDFYHLYDKYGCRIEIGGSDQWGNLTSGLELIRRIKGPNEKVGVMTAHLLLDSNGKKFGKSEGGALYLNPKLCSPYRLYQYFINVGDLDAIRYLKVLTFLEKDEIDKIEEEHNANIGMRIGQKRLAEEIVTIIHGEEKAKEAKLMSEALFKGNIKDLSKENIEELLGSIRFDASEGTLLEDLLIQIKAASSKREAREFIANGSISINGDKLQENRAIVHSDTLHDTYVVVRRGKKNYYLVTLK